MKSKILRKIILGVSTLILTTVSLTASTFAWLNLSDSVNVSNFEFTASSGNGFKVSIDGKNYANKLTTEQLYKAMLVSFGAGRYKILDDRTENLVDTFDNDKVLEKTEIAKLVSDNIQLLPVTSMDGKVLTDLYNSSTSPTTGRFVEFAVYFKTESTSAAEKQKYDIYLNGQTGQDETGSNMEATVITSQITNVPLRANMNTFKYDATTHDKSIVNLYSGGGSINVYSSNAMRLSITDATIKYHLTTDTEFVADKEYYVKDDTTGNYTQEIVTPGDDVATAVAALSGKTGFYEYGYIVDVNSNTNIYELNDTENPYTDLGSYATDYTESAVSGAYSDTYYMYAGECNAMYTYYNNLRTKAQLTDRVLNYTDLSTNNSPILKTIKSLTKTVNGETSRSEENRTITTLASGDPAKLLTFRLWLEGWDADCFDGLSKAVSVKLTFGSQKITN